MYNALGEPAQLRKQIKESSLGQEMKEILSSLMIAYYCLECRYQDFAIRASKNLNMFEEQKQMVGKYMKEWKDKPRELEFPLELILKAWLTIGRGTVMHRDPSNFGLSFAYYNGFGWSGPGVGFPELKLILNLKPGSILGLRARTMYHMSLSPLEGLRMMFAGFVDLRRN
jgi:hypothetical protein